MSDEPGVEFVEQKEQLGTGHAVLVCHDLLKYHTGPVIVIAGDQPMIRAELIREMLSRANSQGAKAFLATAVVKDPFGLGRIVRDTAGNFVRIIEQKDATPQEAAICEINPSFYVFDGPVLFDALQQVRPNNVQKELYLTDVPGILCQRREKVLAEALADETDMFGINHRQHLADAHTLMQERIHSAHLEAGVTIVDPRNTYIDARATIERDTVILPFTVIGGPVEIGRRCRIGPFAHIREGTVLADDVQIGAFVEVVRSQVESGTIAKHLAYLGDTALGKGVNVGAGVITANYDGKGKSPTRIDDDAFLGCGAVLVAPVGVGTGAVVGAGAVVTRNHDVRPGEQVAGVPARPMRPR